MINQPIAPIVPHLGGQAEAVAGSSAAIFTATDRKLLQEITKEPVGKRSFREIFSKKPLTPTVENQETTARAPQNIQELKDRSKAIKWKQKYYGQSTPQEQVEIKSQAEPSAQAKDEPEPKEENDLHQKAAEIAKELKLNPLELFDQFHLSQEELLKLIYRIKELHLKRLLSEKQKDFRALSLKIKSETLTHSKPEAKTWLEEQLDKLTRDAAEYKLGILKSLQALEYTPQREKNITWLEEIVNAAQKPCAPEG